MLKTCKIKYETTVLKYENTKYKTYDNLPQPDIYVKKNLS